MATGVTVDDSIGLVFEDFKLKKGNCKDCSYIMFKVSDDKKSIVIDKLAQPGETFDDFVNSLPEEDGRYAVVDVKFETDDGRSGSKLVFVAWIPDTLKIRKKMLYAGSKDSLKCCCDGVGVVINANDAADIDYETSVLPTVMKFI